MIRKPPLRTYQKKKTAQTSFSYSQLSLWESRSYSKKIPNYGKKNKLLPPQDDENVSEISSGYLETTFDRISKTARLPPPPQQDSYSSINVSSDVPVEESPSVKVNINDFPWKISSPKSKAKKTPKRKATQSRFVYDDGDAVVKKRLKRDLINLSTKKTKAVRNTKRKVSSKRIKNIADSQTKIENHARDLNRNDSEDWFDVRPVKNKEMLRNEKKQKNGYLLRRKKKVPQLSVSTSSDSDWGSDRKVDVDKVKTKLKKNVSRRNTARGKSKTSNSIDTLSNKPTDSAKFKVEDRDGDKKKCFVKKPEETERRESFLVDSCHSVNTSRLSNVSRRTRSKAAIRNSPGLEYVENFRRYSASKSRENNDPKTLGPKKYKRILPNNDTQDRDAWDDLEESAICKNDDTDKKDLPIKPCSVVLLKCNEDEDPVLSKKESMTAPRIYNMHSTEDIFQSSISHTSSNIESQTRDAIKMRFHVSRETQRTQSIENRPNLTENLDQDINLHSVYITEHNAQGMLNKKPQYDRNWVLHSLKSSTPIHAHVNIDRSMNHLSPITLGNDTCPRIRKIVGGKEVLEPSMINYNPNTIVNNKQYLDVPRTRMRRKSARKKLNISYNEDKSLEIRDEYCKENEIIKLTTESITYRRDSSRYGNSKQMLSPTSQIQESLEVLKLNLGNSINKYGVDNKNKRRSSPIAIGTASPDSKGSSSIFESTNKYDDTNEFAGKSKDTCSQLTPTGIITTRSGRQLKLSRTMQEKFFNDSDSKMQPNTSKISHDGDFDLDGDIIENSETGRNGGLKSRITTQRGNQFSVSKSNSNHKACNNVKSSNSTDMLDAYEDNSTPNTSKTQALNHSSYHQSMSRNASSKCSKRSCSKFLTQEYEHESRINNGSSVFHDEKSNRSMSGISDAQNECSTLPNREILQSIRESTESLDSSNLKSHLDVKDESLNHSVSNDDNSVSEWSTMSNSENDEITKNVEQNTTEELKSEYPTCSVGESVDSDAEWSTLSDQEESFEEDKSRNLSSRASKSLMISQQNELDSSSSSKALNQTSKTARDPSFDSSEMALSERMKLLSTRINTRKRLKTFSKPSTDNLSLTFEEQAAIQTSDHSNLTNSVHSISRDTSDSREHFETENAIEIDPLREPNDLDSFKHPLHINLNDNLQPLVILKKLKDPLRITAKDRQMWGLELAAIHETLNETSEVSLTSKDRKTLKDYKAFEKSDPLYLPPRRSKKGNSSVKANRKSASHSNCHIPTLDVSGSEIPERDSMLTSLREVILERSTRKAENSSSKSNKTSPAESRRRASKLNVSDPDVTEQQFLFLKPGKDWTRSLSILNNIQNGSDLEQLSTGKGKNWRKSVQAVLDMQQQQQQERVVQSCLGKNEDDKDTHLRFRALNCTAIPETTPCSEEQSIGSASPGRFIRRMSIRVVPDNKRLNRIEGTSFLEAYGITPSKSGKSLSRRLELESGNETSAHNVQCEDAAIETLRTERIITARDVVLQRCSQDDYLPFAECYPTEYLENCKKIGEGVYGEVFLYEHGKDKSVIKIIPIEGNALVNGERQKRFDEILSEIVIAKELHDLRSGEKNQTYGFVEVKNIRCISGEYPEKLIELWKAYDDEKGSENDCPSMFDDNQLYIALELGHGGEDLEAFVFHSAAEAHALFVQAALALAVAEQSLEFEHRDLHWGNVLISETKDSEVGYKLNNKEYLYPTKGLQVAIIDFTLSRMSYDGCCIFNDLALDPALFTAQGEYQFEIYRLMRDKVGNNWQQFEPYTNLLWLHYTLDKMMTSLRYKRKYARGHREAMFCLHELKDIVLNYESAFDFVTNCEKITSLQCKSTAETTVKSTKTDPINLDLRK